MSFKYVLKYGGKNPTLTKILYVWFDYLGFPPPKGKLNWQALGGEFTIETKETVTRFQQRWSIVPNPPRQYGEVSAREWQQLGIQVGFKAFDQTMYQCLYEQGQCPSPQEYQNFFQNIGGYRGNDLAGGINIYKPRFITIYAEEFGGFYGDVLAGLGKFLEFMRTDANLTDVRQVAYMMATVYKETFYTWQPIDEKGKGAGRKYGLVRIGRCGGKEYKNIYYGRGYVQITWEDNYQLADKELNLNCSLVANPDRAKEPEIAYQIVSQGMKDGWFDPSSKNYKLSDFINGNQCDYFNARKIVNINDTKTYGEIETYAKIFEAMIRATMFR